MRKENGELVGKGAARDFWRVPEKVGDYAPPPPVPGSAASVCTSTLQPKKWEPLSPPENARSFQDYYEDFNYESMQGHTRTLKNNK